MKVKEKVLIIIPAYNEAGNIEKLIDEIEKKCPDYDYVIINDGSTDKTEQICKKRGFNLISLPLNLGIGGAVQTGYRYAYDNGYDIAIQIDGDGQHDCSFLEQMLEPIRNKEAEIVIGSRFIQGKGFQSTVFRRAGIIFLSILIQCTCFVKIKDVTSGLRAVNQRFISIYAKDYPSDYPEPEAIVEAVMNRGIIREIPVVMRERGSGNSSINLAKSIYYMIKVTLAIIVCRISYGVRRGKKNVTG